MGRHELKNKGAYSSRNFSDDWHTIRFDYGWNGNLVWYLDGVETFRVNGAGTQQGYPAPFNQSTKEIKINLALGGRPGPLAAGAVGSTGATFEVDWLANRSSLEPRWWPICHQAELAMLSTLKR